MPEHNVAISTYYLDKYEVTVGRYRQFVNAYASGWRPTVGSGANPNINGSGWLDGWDDSGSASSNTYSNLPLVGADTAATVANFATRLKCSAKDNTWTDTAGANEAAAINCSNWYESFAFCIWDGGRLPTEAEWEYAAAGGSENRVYPWGNRAPDKTLANYNSVRDGKGNPVQAAGSYIKGQARWGHLDLAGGMYEWNLDWARQPYELSNSAVSNPANLTAASVRAVRGGAWDGLDSELRAVARSGGGAPADHTGEQIAGFRCARTAP